MNTASDVVLEQGTTGVYTITNLAYVVDMVKLKPEVETMILQQVQQGGLVVDYTSHHTVKGTIATTTSQRFDLGTINGRVKNCQAVQIASAAANVDQNDSFARNNLSNYRFKLGSRYLSESQIECGADKQSEYVMEWMKSQNLNCENTFQLGSENLTPALLNSTKFVIGQQADRSNSNSVLSSLKDKDHNR